MTKRATTNTDTERTEVGGATESDAAETGDGPAAEPDGGGRPKPYTIRLELVDEPGELLSALEPIAAHGGNLLSIFHERGHLTPRGRIPVEVDLECPPAQFDRIVEALQDACVNVVEADAEQYSEAVTVLLAGDLVGTDLSDTVTRIESKTGASVADMSLSAPAGTETGASARLRLATREGRSRTAMDVVRDVAAEKDLLVVEPLSEGST